MEADESWQWARGAIASLFEHGFKDGFRERKQPPIPYTERNQVRTILQQLISDPDPTASDEAQLDGTSMDPPTLAINSVRGKALNAVVAYALWVRRELDRQLPAPDPSFALMPEVRDALTQHLAITSDPSVAIRSCYGRHLPWLHLLDPSWVTDNVAAIFPRSVSG